MKRLLIPALALSLGFLTSLSGCVRSEAKCSDAFRANVDGKDVDLYTIHGAGGMKAEITNFGARIVSLHVPDNTGGTCDVVLGYDSIGPYMHTDNNFGAAIGPYGNRIARGAFSLDSVRYQLPRNNYGHCLHGGPDGFHNRVWDIEAVSDSSLTLAFVHPDGLDGFPGRLDVTVTYTLGADTTLRIDYAAVTDRPTVVNLTNHTYFNLSGDPCRSIDDEWLMIDADGFTPIDSTFMTSGEILPVQGTPFDFRQMKRVGADIGARHPQLACGHDGYDHNMVLNTGGDLSREAARLYDVTTGIVMTVHTTEPGIQFYTGNFLDGSLTGKGGVAYGRRSALCLETQHFPDSPNKPDWPSTRLDPGEKYASRTIYRFRTL